MVICALTLLSTAVDFNGAYSGQNGAQNRLTNDYLTRSRLDYTVDTRTATEYGVVRTFADLTFSWTTGQYAGVANGGTVYSAAAGAVGNPSDGGIAGGSFGVYHAFIQFAGFTMGKTLSAFDAPWQNYPGNNFDGLVGGSGFVTAVNQLTYTWQFGNGSSFAVSAQDPTAYSQSNLYNLGAFGSSAVLSAPVFTGGAYGVNGFGGTRAPDLIGTFKVDQAWGMFQLSAVGHNNHAGYYASASPAISGTEPAGHPDDKWGWAVQAALQFKNIPTGPGDVINMQAVYTDGATRYNFQSLALSTPTICRLPDSRRHQLSAIARSRRRASGGPCRSAAVSVGFSEWVINRSTHRFKPITMRYVRLALSYR